MELLLSLERSKKKDKKFARSKSRGEHHSLGIVDADAQSKIWSFGLDSSDARQRGEVLNKRVRDWVVVSEVQDDGVDVSVVDSLRRGRDAVPTRIHGLTDLF